MRTKEEIQKAVGEIRLTIGKPTVDTYREGYLQALAWVLDEDVPSTAPATKDGACN